MLSFCKKMLTSAKLREPWYSKVYFLQLHVCVLTYQISSYVSGIILTSFRQGVILPPPRPPPFLAQNEPLKSPPRLGLKEIFLIWLSKFILLSNITPNSSTTFEDLIAFPTNNISLSVILFLAKTQVGTFWGLQPARYVLS